VLKKYLAMENFEGSELRKVIKWVKIIVQQKDCYQHFWYFYFL
jgi:hypothetical protein